MSSRSLSAAWKLRMWFGTCLFTIQWNDIYSHQTCFLNVSKMHLRLGLCPKLYRRTAQRSSRPPSWWGGACFPLPNRALLVCSSLLKCSSKEICAVLLSKMCSWQMDNISLKQCKFLVLQWIFQQIDLLYNIQIINQFGVLVSFIMGPGPPCRCLLIASVWM